MAHQVGDLWPYASGTASLGVEQLNGEGGFSDDYRPFAHVHMNSGVYHGSMGLSGVVRFAENVKKNTSGGLIDGFDFSVDGGITYPFAIGTEQTPTLRTRLITDKRLAVESLNRNDLVLGSYSIAVNDNGAVPGSFNVVAQGAGSIAASDDINLSSSIGNILSSVFAGSGQLRYKFGPHEAWSWKPSYGGTGGPESDGFYPLPHSGQILQMILENGVAGNQSLQAAYDGGDEIQLVTLRLQDDVTPGFEGHTVDGVLFKEPMGAYLPIRTEDKSQAIESYSIAVSGTSDDPTNLNSFGLVRITQQSIDIRSSGVPSANSDSHSLFIGYDGNDGGGVDPNHAWIYTSGELSIDVADRLTIRQRNNAGNQAVVTLESQTASVNLGFDGGSANDINFRGIANLDAVQDMNLSAGQAFEIDAFDLLDAGNGSGQFKYRFGPYEAWHTTVGAGNKDLVPIPHSGHVLQMILENAPGGGGGAEGLQRAYNADPTIVTDGTTPVTVIADDHVGARFSPIGETAGIPISLSGFVQRPTTAVENVGDMLMFRTSFGSDGRPQRGNATSDAEAQALSLGPGVLAWNTGSGIIPAAIGSGITQFVNISVIELPDDTTGTGVTWNTFGNQFQDRFYDVASNDDFVTILVPGFYMASYKVSLSKLDGNQRSTVATELLLNEAGIIGSTSSAYLRNTEDSNNTANGVCLFNAEPGDQIKLQAAKQTNLSEGVRINTRECTLVLQYISPPRGGISAI